MRITTARVLGLVALLALLLGGAATGQAPAPDAKKPAEEKKPSQLEELIAQALLGNPDLRVAESKVREAEAELNRARLQVIQKVVAHQHTVDTLMSGVKTADANYTLAEAKLKQAEADYKRMTNLGAVAPADLDAARANLEQAKANLETAKAALQAAKADLAKAQAELPYLLGKATKDDKADAATRAAVRWLNMHQAEGDSATAHGLRALAEANFTAWKAGQQPQGTIPEKLRKALDRPVDLKFAEVPVDEILAHLQRLADVPVVPATGGDLVPTRLAKKLTLNLPQVPLGAAFQLLEDVAGLQFAVRDYGILVESNQVKLRPDMLPLHDFWKGGEKPKAAAEKPQGAQEKPR